MQSGGGCAVMIGLLRYCEARAENSVACELAWLPSFRRSGEPTPFEYTVAESHIKLTTISLIMYDVSPEPPS
jgi:hypothetical protein